MQEVKFVQKKREQTGDPRAPDRHQVRTRKNLIGISEILHQKRKTHKNLNFCFNPSLQIQSRSDTSLNSFIRWKGQRISAKSRTTRLGLLSSSSSTCRILKSMETLITTCVVHVDARNRHQHILDILQTRVEHFTNMSLRSNLLSGARLWSDR